MHCPKTGDTGPCLDRTTGAPHTGKRGESMRSIARIQIAAAPGYRCLREQVPALCYPSGLGIQGHRMPGSGRWGIVHLPTGRLVIRGIKTLPQEARVVRELERLPFDWRKVPEGVYPGGPGMLAPRQITGALWDIQNREAPDLSLWGD